MQKNLSSLDVGVAILATSFVSYLDPESARFLVISSLHQVSHLIFRFFEPRSLLSRATLLLIIPALLSQLISYTGHSLYAAVPLAFTTHIGALIFFTLAYRLSPFHPLAKYPGPVIAKTSKWWAAYISARGDPQRYIKHLHDRYGDVVRTGKRRCFPLRYIHLSIFRPQRTLDSRRFPHSPCTWPRWPTQRTTCVDITFIFVRWVYLMIRLG